MIVLMFRKLLCLKIGLNRMNTFTIGLVILIVRRNTKDKSTNRCVIAMTGC
jgi:hypothetical protein